MDVTSDPAGPYEDGLPDETRLKMKRIPVVVGILRQIDRVSYLLSVEAPAASAVQTLYALTSPYLKRLPEWEKRWDARACAGVLVGGQWVAAPQPADYAAWLELIMDGLMESGVVFEETRLSYVGPARRMGPNAPPRPPGPEPPVGPPGLGGDAPGGAGGPGAAPGVVGMGVGVGARVGPGSLGFRVQPGRGPKRAVPVDVRPVVPHGPVVAVDRNEGGVAVGEAPREESETAGPRGPGAMPGALEANPSFSGRLREAMA